VNIISDYPEFDSPRSYDPEFSDIGRRWKSL